MKLLILGHGRHGKDTVAEMISTLYGLKFSSSSRAALKAIFPALRALYNFDVADTNEAMEAAYNERHQHREVWKALISLYNAHDKSALCRLILEENDMYVGMRCEKEYKACKHLFDAVIYVQAGVRVGKKDPTMGIPFVAEEMFLLNNDFFLEDTLEEVKAICQDKLGLSPL